MTLGFCSLWLVGTCVLLGCIVSTPAHADLDRDAVNARDYVADAGEPGDAAITQALEAIGTSQQTLLLSPGRWKIAGSLTVPSNVNLVLAYGAGLEVADDATVRIDGPLDVTGIQQVFFGKGTIEIASNFQGEVYPQWWGEINDKDDTDACQRALSSGAQRIHFPKAVYAIDAVGDGGETGRGLRVGSNTTLIFDPGAILRVIPTKSGDYTVLKIRSVENVLVEGVTVRGDRDDHPGKGGEWGHGIRITGSSRNIRVKNATVSDCWGDGIYLGEGHVEDIRVENSRFDNNRRNACSIISASNVLFTSCTFSNTHGTSPHKGVDIEPNLPKDRLENIVFEDCDSHDNLTGGFTVAYDGSLDSPVSVTFRNCRSENDGFGFAVDLGPSDTPGLLTIRDCTVINPGEDGFKTCGNLRTIIDGLYILNPNQREESRELFGHGMSFIVWPDRGNSLKPVGNVVARNVFIQSTDEKAKFAIYFDNQVGKKSGFQNIDIQAHTDMDPKHRVDKGEGPFKGYYRIDFQE